MMSLFSSFDLYFFYFPVLCFFMFSLMSLNKIFKVSSVNFLYSKVKSLNKFFLSIKPKMYSKFSLCVIISSMASIFILNFISIFSFCFPLTSQFGPVFMFGLSIWLSFVLFMLFNNIYGFLSHLIPEGAPVYLTFVLFLIELVSSLIRPITLSVRLVANIMAGHLLMILLSKLVFIKGFLFPAYIILNMVELFVAAVQSYIFCTMISLYFSEVY